MAKAHREVLEAILSDGPPRGTTWRHFKYGDLYIVIDTGVFEKDLEPMVFYKSLSDGMRWFRTFGEWFEDVKHDGKFVPRYTRVD